MTRRLADDPAKAEQTRILRSELVSAPRTEFEVNLITEVRSSAAVKDRLALGAIEAASKRNRASGSLTTTRGSPTAFR